MPMLEKDDNLSDNFGPYIDKKSALGEPEIETNDINFVDESLDIKSCIKDIVSGCTPQEKLFGSELLSSLKEVKFSEP